MRHQAGDIALFVADTGDIVERTVRIGDIGGFSLRIDIAPEDLVVDLEFAESFLIGKVASFTMSDGKAEQLPGRDLVSKSGIRCNGFQKDMFTAELERAVADQGSGQKAGLAQDLKAIADSQHEPTLFGECLHCLHDGAESSDGAGAEVIPVTESTGNDYGVGVS
jgi:hypothetical protein